jgi:hypothetical protein
MYQRGDIFLSSLPGLNMVPIYMPEINNVYSMHLIVACIISSSEKRAEWPVAGSGLTGLIKRKLFGASKEQTIIRRRPA